MSSKKKPPKIFYLFLVIIPIIFLLILEISLVALDYGQNLNQWHNITSDKLILNPDIGARYFSNINNYPHSNHDSFYKVKKENTFRVFVFGGSTTAGFPYQPNGNFSRYLRDRLKLSYPQKIIEVINLGITAVNTYTIKDLLPGVIEYEPDLVIIYAGHNEYYGALGVGSTQSIGRNPFVINSFLYLNNFRTTQLVKNTIQSIVKIFFEKNSNVEGSTLMARMASEKAIKFNSNIYKKGVDQFKNNLNSILKILSKNKIPTIIGTLVSKTRDQPPFVSFNQDKNLSADYYYSTGIKEIEDGNFGKADSLLNLAKDLDGLKFRAPSEFNSIIKNLASIYELKVVDIEELFKLSSPNGIVGNNLMVDHLHPTLEGHFKIGNFLFQNIMSLNLLQTEDLDKISFDNDKIIRANFNFTKLDSISAGYRISNLLNDWPFMKGKISNKFREVNSKSKIDSLAFSIVNKNMNWEVAHQKTYMFYLANNDINNFVKELKVLISQYPYKLEYYNYAAQELIHRKKYKDAQEFLENRYQVSPDYFSTKWLGNISLSNNSFKTAIKFFNESLVLNSDDPQVYYNLAVAYLKINNFAEALESIRSCIRLKPNYPNASGMEKQLIQKIKKPTNKVGS